MASEYLMKKYQDIKPDEPVLMTKEERRRNWWHYHWKLLLISVVCVSLIAYMAFDILSKKEPDYEVIYVSHTYIQDQTLESIQAALTSVADDRNGDGEIIVQVSGNALLDDDPMSSMVEMSTLAEISAQSAELLLLDDPSGFQEQYWVLVNEDGSIPQDAQDPSACMKIAWNACPALADAAVPDELYLSYRYFPDEVEDYDAFLQYWDRLTADSLQEPR